MTQDRPDFETLNAYVDGELDDAAVAAVARAVAADPVVARQVATLAELRSTMAEMVETPALALPAAPQPRRRWPRFAVAAALAAFVLGAGALHLASPPADAAAWYHAAWRLHGDWVERRGDDVERMAGRRAALVRAAAPQPLARAYVPDLSAARLAVVYVGTGVLLRDAPALVVGYAGSRGCRVTLVVTQADVPAAEALDAFAAGAGRGYAWRAGGLVYLLLNQGMDGPRFRQLADTVHRTSLERLPIDERTRTALASSRRASRPCTA